MRERVGEKCARPCAGIFVEIEVARADALQPGDCGGRVARHAEEIADIEKLVEWQQDGRRVLSLDQPPVPDHRQLGGVHKLPVARVHERIWAADAFKPEDAVESRREHIAKTGDARGLDTVRFHMREHGRGCLEIYALARVHHVGIELRGAVHAVAEMEREYGKRGEQHVCERECARVKQAPRDQGQQRHGEDERERVAAKERAQRDRPGLA